MYCMIFLKRASWLSLLYNTLTKRLLHKTPSSWPHLELHSVQSYWNKLFTNRFFFKRFWLLKKQAGQHGGAVVSVIWSSLTVFKSHSWAPTKSLWWHYKPSLLNDVSITRTSATRRMFSSQVARALLDTSEHAHPSGITAFNSPPSSHQTSLLHANGHEDLPLNFFLPLLCIR